MSEKKHKSGYDLLKEKYATLETKLAKTEAARYNVFSELSQVIERVNELKKERDEWKAKWQQADAAKQDAVDKYNRKQEDYDYLMRSFKIDEMRIAFLLDHCTFWVRWLYRKQFEKGGKE